VSDRVEDLGAHLSLLDDQEDDRHRCGNGNQQPAEDEAGETQEEAEQHGHQGHQQQRLGAEPELIRVGAGGNRARAPLGQRRAAARR